MILWLPPGSAPDGQSLENFLFAFRVKGVAEAILNGCDIAVVPIPELGQINLIIPRDLGTFNEVVADWHLNVAPHYPYTEIIMGPTGLTGLTDAVDSLMRFRIQPEGVEAIAVAEEDYAQVISSLSRNCNAWFVSQPDSTLRFHFRAPEPGIRHSKLSLEMSYHPDEYLPKIKA